MYLDVCVYGYEKIKYVCPKFIESSVPKFEKVMFTCTCMLVLYIFVLSDLKKKLTCESKLYLLYKYVLIKYIIIDTK